MTSQEKPKNLNAAADQPSVDVAAAMFEQPTTAETLKPATDNADAALQAEAEAVADRAERHLFIEARAFLGAVFSWVLVPLAIVLFIHAFIFQPYHVIGSSMQPTLQESNYLIISKIGQTVAGLSRAFGNNSSIYIPKRGEIVVFHFPKEPSRVFVKRVIGLPGDRVVVKGGKVAVYNKDYPDGFNPDAGYETANVITTIDTDATVNPGNVFVIGDNRLPGESYDSRDWGELPSSYIVGHAVMRLWPFDEVKLLP